MARQPPPESHAPAKRHRSRAARIASIVLIIGLVALFTRISLATFVQVHGDGMAPTLLDGERVLWLRNRWWIDRGDVVVYDPDGAIALDAAPPRPREPVPPPGRKPVNDQNPDVRRRPRSELRNAAVMNTGGLEANWKRVQARANGIATRAGHPLRLGRLIAMTGDRVTFHVPNAPLGITINGLPLKHEQSSPILVQLQGERASGVGPQIRQVSYEMQDNRRYPVLEPIVHGPHTWDVLRLPDASGGPVEMTIEGYLVLADHRRAGKCCDSRSLGLIPKDAIEGQVVMRLAGNPSATPDLDPARGTLWWP